MIAVMRQYFISLSFKLSGMSGMNVYNKVSSFSFLGMKIITSVHLYSTLPLSALIKYNNNY